jgi:4-amino-4-deoxy-L-arabinose transferase-like glycosyltransferase
MPMPRPALLTWIAAATALILLFARLGDLPLIQPDEGRNAEVAREMKVSGAWLIPTYDGLPYMDKPALYFKTVALSLAVLGDTETAARLPSALFALALLAALYAFCRRESGARSAALVSIVVAATPLYFAFARMVIFDMALAFFVSVAIGAAYLAEASAGAARRAWWMAGAASAGVAVLVKGPVGFIVPSLVVLAFFAVERDRAALKRFFAPLNFLAFFAFVLPWFFAVTAQRPDFPAYGLVEETFRRYTTTSFHRTAPWYYYAPVTLAVLFPWSALLFEGSVRALRARSRLTRLDRLFAVWAVVVIIFFSTSQSKLPGYILSGAVAAAALIGRLFAMAWRERTGAAAGTVFRGALVLAALAGAVAILCALNAAEPGTLQRLLHIRSREFDRLDAVFLPAAISLATVAAAAIAAAWSRRVPLAFAAFLLFPLSLVTVSFGGVREYAEASSSRALAARLSALPETTELAGLECYPNGLSFYLRRTMTVITRDGGELTSNYVLYMLRRAEAWPPGVVRLEELPSWLASRPHPVYLLARGRRLEALRAVAAERGLEPVDLGGGWHGVELPRPGDAPLEGRP